MLASAPDRGAAGRTGGFIQAPRFGDLNRWNQLFARLTVRHRTPEAIFNLVLLTIVNCKQEKIPEVENLRIYVLQYRSTVQLPTVINQDLIECLRTSTSE